MSPSETRMTEKSMNVQQLLEQAVLDAVGLLDDDEREAFERGFAAAPPAVRIGWRVGPCGVRGG